MSWAMIIALVLIIVVFMVLNNRSAKKRQKEQQDMLNAIQPGNKVKTIGGICGIVVEVNPEDNTFVLETGTEASGKSYLKFDKQAVYQTDATVKKTEPAPAEDTKEENAAEATEKTEQSETVEENRENIEETETKE
jgi:preprotein translocase subunit YajC